MLRNKAQSEKNELPEMIYEDTKLGQIILLKDQSLLSIFSISKRPFTMDTSMPSSQYIMGRKSFDHGKTWTTPEVIVEFPLEKSYVGALNILITEQGTIHIFSNRVSTYDFDTLKFVGDILHTKIKELKGPYSTKKMECVDRYCGSINSVIELKSGRIVVPLGTLTYENGIPKNVSGAIFSDDDGETWHKSNDININDSESENIESGLLEPVAVELDNDRLLMIIRTTLGRIYYSLSFDGGMSWQAALATNFHASNSPASLRKLPGGELILLWNNCLGVPVEFSHSSYARQALHAAISEDNGATWNGYRCILMRNSSDPQDINITSPDLFEIDNHNILIKTMIVKDWRDECLIKLFKTPCENFKKLLKESCLYEDFHHANQPWITKNNNVETVNDREREKYYLEMKSDIHFGSAVVSFNFPFGKSGKIKLGIKGGPLFSSAKIVLSPYYMDAYNFSNENINKDGLMSSLYQDALTASLASETGNESKETLIQIEKNVWNEIEICWDTETHEAKFYVNRQIQNVLALNANGFCYLTIILDVLSGYPQSMFIDYIEAMSFASGESGIVLDP